MTLILELPRGVDERLQRDAQRKGIPKESLAVDIISRSVGAGATGRKSTATFWSPVPFESLVLEQGVEPIVDFKQWLANLPGVEGAEELAERVDKSRRERREIDRTHQ